MNLFGFVAEPHRNNCFLLFPATKDKDTGDIVCHDTSGFCGSWKMKDGGVFFKAETDSCFCEEAMGKAIDYCNQMNGEVYEM